MSQINLSDELTALAQEQVAAGRFGSIAEYLRYLITLDRCRVNPEQLEAQLAAGLDSGTPELVDEDWWAKRQRAADRSAN